MRISDISVDGFGIWHDRVWKGLSEGVNVFLGPNEAGKTTLMSFVRSILFGFERRRHPRRYEPLGGGEHGGSLGLALEEKTVRVERKAGRHVRGAVAVHHDDGTGDERMLESILGGTTRTLYHNVFAFGLEELEHFRTLEESEVASHISGAGMGVGASRWSRVQKDLEERRGKLFLPRGQNSTINRSLKELEAVRDELDRTEHEPEEYVAVHEERASLEAEIQALEESISLLSSRVVHYEKLRKVEPYRKRRSQVEKRLAGLETIDSFPEGGVQSLNLLLHQRRQLDDGLARHRAENEQRRQKRAELAARYTPQELIRRSRAVESLRLLLPRLDAADDVVAAAAAKQEAVSRELAAMSSAARAARPPSGIAMTIFMVLVGLVGAVLFLMEQRVAGGGIGAVLAVMALWYYGRTRQASRLGAQVEACAERLRSAEEGVRKVEDQCSMLRSNIEALIGRPHFSGVDMARAEAKVRDLGEMAERIRSLDEALELEDRQREAITKQVADNEGKILSLLEAAGAATESEFFRRGELFKKRQQLQIELDRTPSGNIDPEPGMEGIDALDADAYRAGVAELEASRARLAESRRACGGVDERIRSLGRSEERSRVRLRQESILAGIDEASEKWAVLTLCRTLLEETRKIYEIERQPAVLRSASEFFNQMSEGRYTRVISPLGSADLLVEREDGTRLGPEHLSRGTAEQLYLAVRLALVREYSRHVEPLPVIFDDIFVNFDPERARNSIEAVRDLSETHQILLFTCHPHFSERVGEIVPDAKVFPLQ